MLLYMKIGGATWQQGHYILGESWRLDLPGSGELMLSKPRAAWEKIFIRTESLISFWPSVWPPSALQLARQLWLLCFSSILLFNITHIAPSFPFAEKLRHFCLLHLYILSEPLFREPLLQWFIVDGKVWILCLLAFLSFHNYIEQYLLCIYSWTSYRYLKSRAPKMNTPSLAKTTWPHNSNLPLICTCAGTHAHSRIHTKKFQIISNLQIISNYSFSKILWDCKIGSPWLPNWFYCISFLFFYSCPGWSFYYVSKTSSRSHGDSIHPRKVGSWLQEALRLQGEHKETRTHTEKIWEDFQRWSCLCWDPKRNELR